MDTKIILSALLLLILIFAVVRIMHKPIQWTLKLVVNCAIGLVAIMIVNYLGSFMGIHLPVNPISVLSVGVLGLPGMLLLVCMNFLLT
ncbi:inhibitor of the pro-sigma K processing machinery [Desulfonispora thiosulfatigenes DSM 11270]|uniref:Inhibitor of the pro-sigma K processing machinery n=1 Tax=Desulfonispora thiosulfatigenes DSM 11270 TaxID=656914 RepID=A0A1W1V149_DESTI|nr:pro-sigmaK processing inhibitor BofA family protein [Desulfonispora thiosulfatigenes]SMB87036.1 inhibitor of the pro-sigma K processing machinery [Desulfonispora thiosulfatigenes DSM 11270]